MPKKVKSPRRSTLKKKVTTPCPFCEKLRDPDYKDYKILRVYLSDRSKILGKDRTGVCSRHQRILSREIKRARYLGLLPFIAEV